MPLAKDRELTSITTKAHKHMKKIVADFNKIGIPESNMHWLSKLILSQRGPLNSNGTAHIVGKDAPVAIIPSEPMKVSAKVEGLELTVEEVK